MDGSDSSISIIDTEHTRTDGHSVEQAILVTIEPRWTDNGRLGEAFSHRNLAGKLAAIVLRLRVGGGVEVRDMDKARYSSRVGNTGNSARSRDVHVGKGKVSTA